MHGLPHQGAGLLAPCKVKAKRKAIENLTIQVGLIKTDKEFEMILLTGIVGTIVYLISKFFKNNKEVVNEQSAGDRDR